MSRSRSRKKYDPSLYISVAWAYIFRAILLPVSLVFLVWACFLPEKPIVTTAIILCALTLIFSIFFWIESGRVLCILCRTPFLKHLNCAKKKGRIPHVLGDRSFATAISLVIRKKAITCQYCAEKQIYNDK